MSKKPADIQWKPAAPVTLKAKKTEMAEFEWDWTFDNGELAASVYRRDDDQDWHAYVTIDRYPDGLIEDDGDMPWHYKRQEGSQKAADPQTALDLALQEATSIQRANQKVFAKRSSSGMQDRSRKIHKAMALLAECVPPPDDEEAGP